MSVGYRVLVLAALCLAALVVVVPTFVKPPPSWWPWKQSVRLGLDLQGGTHLLYQVQIEQAIDNQIDRVARDVERELRDAQLGAFTAERVERTIQVKLANRDKRSTARKEIQDRFAYLKVQESASADAADLALELDERELVRIRDGVVEQALNVMRNRIDEFGVVEPTLQVQGDDEIVVQLPGIQDPQRAKDLIGRTAVLEFRFVAQGPQAGTAESPGPGMLVLSGERESCPPTGRCIVERRPIMTGDVLTDARVQPGGSLEGPVVDFVLDSQGAKLFGDATTTHVGRQLAIVLDNYVQSAPVIREPITGGRGQISGRFTFEEAQDLANVLRNGALPAPLKLMEERTVGPSLGKDSIRQGTLSFLVGSALVWGFMLIYYRGGGVITDIALLLNVILLVGTFALFGFTLTLPGLAGLVLTVGMAVDANILILERMREELRLGKNARAAIEAGYDRAWSAILDSNVTLFLSGLIMFQFGSGPVRGFAVTMCVGIATTLLTSVFATRVMYDWLVTQRRLTTVSV
jgi:preprotein translocase subunit SecD